MKTVLMIAPYFVPRRRVGSLRPYKFATHLSSFGWSPTVFTIGTPNEELTQKEKEALKGVTIKEINPPFDRTTGKKSQQASSNMEVKNRVWAEWSDWLAEWFDRQVPMDTWLFLFWSAYSKILKEAEHLDPDLIWSTGDPWSGHWLGHKLSEDLDKPWIADFRDPWTLSGLSLRERSFFSSRADSKLEKKYVNKVDKLIFTAKSAETLYIDYYSLPPVKADTIYNSYNTPDGYAKNDNAKEWDPNLDDSRLHVIFFGSFRRLSPVTPIADAIAAMPDEYQKNIRVHSFGRLTDEDKNRLREMNISTQFVTHEKVVPEQAPSVFKKADLLLVSTSSERKSIIPAKMWEYFISDKPILSITPNPEVGEILRETGAGVHFHNRQSSEIADILKKAIDQKQKGESLLDIKRQPSVIETYSAKNNTQKLAQIMDTLIGDEQ
jgi:glycosyltransferase involved in cell wall biosynthesis